MSREVRGGWTLRPYTPADASAFAALQSLGGRATTAGDLLSGDARRPPADLLRRRLLVTQDGTVLGGSQVRTFAFVPPDHLQAAVLVHPAARAQGAGEILWADLHQAARDAGALGLSADVPDTDPSALSWAQRRGFQVHAHRFASELNLTAFDPAPFQESLAGARVQGVTFTDLRGADQTVVDRYLHFVADRLIETPDLAGQPRWSADQVRAMLRLTHDPRPDWLILAVGPDGTWLGTTALVRFPSLPFVYNELTAMHPAARGRGLALPLKLQIVERARAEGYAAMRTNNHARNAPMLAVNRRLGFKHLNGRFEVRRPL
ncbi:GNAT family N-acetyltransferase [Deinococcus taeanensis]|uniref:GNAT family N-acetyltransferase n=1 Tax=Deinococcus taeanensis TaxID=2737050 RepID=UPI001CDD32B1|nr:GNAT family N-acetyltransferase [Deinococcus taeanensis]UBV42550.1 GNAT family N-acetyltransferase [Deinococcus taeanensis]